MSDLPIDDGEDDELPPDDIEIDRSVSLEGDGTAEVFDEDDVEQLTSPVEDVEPLDPDDPLDLADIYRAVDANETPRVAKVDTGGASIDDETNPHQTGR